MGPNQNFEPGKIYLVVHRTWDNSKTVKAKRKFRYAETRFGEIPCFVFTSRIQRGAHGIGFRWNATEVSIPHYDLISVQEVNQ